MSILSKLELTMFKPFLHTKFLCTKWEAFLFLFLIVPFTVVAQLQVEPERSNATYEIGEMAAFRVISSITGTANYTISFDDKSPVLSEGTIELVAGVAQTVSYQLNEPGVIICTVTMGEDSEIAGATYQPLDIQPFISEPAGFDAFWDQAKAELAAVPIDADTSYYLVSRESRAYRLNLGHIDGRRVWGYITVPSGPGPFPGVVEFPPAGSAGYLAQQNFQLAERGNFLAVSISIHNVPPEEIDPNSYMPNDITDPNTNYYKYAVLAGVRAIDYLYSRSDFNQEDIAVMGFSQGGGLAMMVAGVDERVDVLASSIPSHCQHGGIDENKASGFPFYLLSTPPDQKEVVRTATGFYDNNNFVKRFKGPSWVFLNYEDLVCPAATGFSAFNQLEGPKILLNTIDLDHNTPVQYFEDLYNFFRRHIPASRQAPKPESELTQGYAISAGVDQSVELETAVQLNGSVIFNDRTNHLSDIRWRQISGPDGATISDDKSYTTEVRFTNEGEYTFQLVANDNDLLNSSNQFITLVDQVDIKVCTDRDGDGICSTMECNDNDAATFAAVGDSCDDGNPDTTDDKIQEESCNCVGTLIVVEEPEEEVPVMDSTEVVEEIDTPIMDTTQIIEEVDVPIMDSTEVVEEIDTPTMDTTQTGGGIDTTQVIEIDVDTTQIEEVDIELDSTSIEEIELDTIDMPLDSLEEEIVECIDNDGDGICADLDCDDRDPTPCSKGLIFPNPARDRVVINLTEFEGKPITVGLYDMGGNLISFETKEDVSSPSVTMDLSQVTNGVYWIAVRTRGIPLRTDKLVVSRLY